MFLKPLCCSEWTNQRVTDNTIDPVSHWPPVPWFDLEALEFSFVINTHWNCEKICCLHTFCHWIPHVRPAVEVKWLLALHPNISYREKTMNRYCWTIHTLVLFLCFHLSLWTLIFHIKINMAFFAGARCYLTFQNQMEHRNPLLSEVWVLWVLLLFRYKRSVQPNGEFFAWSWFHRILFPRCESIGLFWKLLIN